MLDQPLTEGQSRLVADNIGLAKKATVERCRGKHWHFDDVLEGAYNGLMWAAKAYRPEMGHCFSSLAWRVIHRGITYHLRNIARRRGDGPARLCRFDPEIHGGSFAVAPKLADDSPDFEAIVAGCRMPERHRQVLRLRFAEGLTLQEIGERLGFTRERARMLERKALARLRESKAARSAA